MTGGEKEAFCLAPEVSTPPRKLSYPTFWLDLIHAEPSQTLFVLCGTCHAALEEDPHSDEVVVSGLVG